MKAMQNLFFVKLKVTWKRTLHSYDDDRDPQPWFMVMLPYLCTGAEEMFLNLG
jgi:hypothetical protein